MAMLRDFRMGRYGQTHQFTGPDNILFAAQRAVPTAGTETDKRRV